MKSLTKFWRYNKVKFIYWSILGIIFTAIFQYFFISAAEIGAYIINPKQIFGSRLFFTFLPMWPMIFLAILIPELNHFKLMDRLSTDTSEKSILVVFDNGIVLELVNEKSKMLFTRECITGAISGLPVKISCSDPRKEYLNFSCYPLVRRDSEEKTERSTTFRLNYRNRLNVDIKPIISEFIAEIISEGYTSGIEKK